MTHDVRALKTLIAVRRRRGERLRRDLSLAQAAVAEAERVLSEKTQAQEAARMRALEGQERMEAQLSKAFNPDDHLGAELRQKELVLTVVQAQAETVSADSELVQRRAVASRVRRAISVNDQRIGHFQEQMQHVQAQRQLAEVEQADEEAEEASIARMLGARRRAREGDDGQS